MKHKIATVALSLILVVSALTLIPSTAASPLSNESFETGDFSGWTTSTDWSGGAYVVNSWYPFIAPIGYYMCVVAGGLAGSWQRVYQTAYFNAGDTVGGQVAFFGYDALPNNDEGEIRIGGTQIWYHNLAMGVMYEWDTWQWTAPASGIYTVEFRCRNINDRLKDSFLYLDIGRPTQRIEILREDFETMAPEWYSEGYDNLWHITEHRSVSRTHSMYYGIEDVWNYDTGGHNYGMLFSPVLTLPGDKPQVRFEYWMASEGQMPYDTGWFYVIINSNWYYILDYYAHRYKPWDMNLFNIPAGKGDTIQLMFYFDTVDWLENGYEGWYIDDVVVTVEEQLTELAVIDSGFAPGTIAPGGGGIAYVTVENIGHADARISSYSWEGADIALSHELSSGPKILRPGEQATYTAAVHVNAGTNEGLSSVVFVMDYNSGGDSSLVETVDINIQWKMTGSERSSYVGSQDALRHIRRLDYNIKAGYVPDGGELEEAVNAFLAGDYVKAKNSAVGPGGLGLGFWGLEPGQVEGNEGNGNGGLSGPKP